MNFKIDNKEAVTLLRKHFDSALETPDGVKKLRELILKLAMQGKLVQQDERDQPARELLKEIEAEKKILIKEGKIRKQDSLPPIKPEDIPYEIPRAWEWVRLSEIVNVGTGSTPATTNHSYYNGTIPWYTSSATNNPMAAEPDKFITEKAIKETNCKIFPMGSLIIALYGQGKTRGQISEIVIPGATNQAIAAMVFYESSQSIKLYLKYFFVKIYSEIRLLAAGAAQPNLNVGKIKTTLIPLPPLAEQKRIVSKINDLMTLCDKLESQRNERNNKRLKIHAAAINKLLTAPDKSEFNSSWGFITKNFSELYSVKENVEELKKAILQLAVMGKLVPQDPKDQPASELLKEIEAEKKRLVKEGKIKNKQLLPEVRQEEFPFKIPNEWGWTRLVEVGEINPRNKADDELNVGFVPMALIFAEYGKDHKFEERNWSEIKSGFTHFRNDDVVLAKITPCFENGKSCVIKGLPNEIGSGTTELHVYRNSFSITIPEYVLAFVKSPLFFRTGIPKMTGTAGQKRVPTEFFSLTPFPLPPLAEQKRIVAKVDQLMSLCNTLVQQVNNSTDKQTAILNAVLAKI